MLKIKSVPAQVSEVEKNQLRQAYHAVLAQKQLGFLQLPERAQLRDQCVARAKELRAKGSRLFFFGIGGSSLGPQIIADVFSRPGEVVICDNLDPHFITRALGDASAWKDAVFVFVSKSGTTLETLGCLQFVHEKIQPVDPKWTERALVITENKPSPLAQWAQHNKVQQIEVPLDVGGRFSILSPVGMVMAEWLGQKAADFHAGAAEALKNEDRIIELAGQFMRSFERGEWVTQLWTYSSSLRQLSAWVVQLWAESLAKAKDRKGQKPKRVSTPQAAIGAIDQHSILQQVMEGYRDKLVVIQRLKAFPREHQFAAKSLFEGLPELGGQSMGGVLNVEATATAEALKHQGVSVLEIELEDMSAKSIGEILMTWMLVVALMGEVLDINAFDQPGVELGKRLAKGILKNGVLPEL